MIGATAGGPGAKNLFSLRSAAIETALLLTSSFTFGMASLAMKYGENRGPLMAWTVVTLLLGLAFLGFEASDFMTMIEKGAPASRSGFLSAFFTLVACHGLHVTAGCIWMIVMMIQIRTLGIARDVKTRMMRLGLFWHFLDIVWVAIFSIVYLQGLA
jgi:cytochrome o ubiquinol oxidase subunit 3